VNFPWCPSFNIEIAKTKEEAIRLHASDSYDPIWRIYTDGSGLNNRISTAAVGCDFHYAALLGTISDAQVFHGELAGIDLGLRQLSQQASASSTETTAMVYSDSQAALEFLQKGDPTHSQAIYKNIKTAVESLAIRNIQVKFRWLPGHKKIVGNELADEYARTAARMVGPCVKPETRFLSAVKRRIKDHLDIRWKQRWTNYRKSKIRMNGTVKLIPEITQATRKLHAGLSKGCSALLIQLRTGVIGFNDFLYKRRVPTILSPRCACDTAAMTVRHVLLDCPTWSEARRGHLGTLQTADLRKLLNDPNGAKAAVKFILYTDLLAQFRTVARQEQAKHLHLAQNHTQETEWNSNSGSGFLFQIEDSESDNTQSDSENACSSPADSMLFTGVECS
jgi:ribonuclease HI